MTEYRFGGALTVGSGATTFRVRNEGKQAHDLTLIEVPETLRTSLAEQLGSDRRMPALPIARIKPRSPGQSGFFAVDLQPGRYGIVCFVRAPDGASHARMGMSREFIISNSS